MFLLFIFHLPLIPNPLQNRIPKNAQPRVKDAKGNSASGHPLHPGCARGFEHGRFGYEADAKSEDDQTQWSLDHPFAVVFVVHAYL